MHDAMSDGDRVDLQIVPQPSARRRQRLRRRRGRSSFDSCDRPARCRRPRDAQSRAASDPIHLTLDLALQVAVLLDSEDLELDA